MNDDDIFIRLVEAVEEQGGELLPETHHPEMHTYYTPQPNGRTRRDEVPGGGCGFEALMSVPYDKVEIARDGTESGAPEQAFVTACAVDDCLHMWPRFMHVNEA